MIEVACSADTPYLPHVSAMLHSLLTHTQQRPLRIWLMYGKTLSEDGRARVTEVVTGGKAQIEFFRVPDELMVGFPTSKFHYSCWYRILLPDLLPQLDRILYLDCDVIVTDDLEPLWSTDLGDKPFAACINPMLKPMLKPVREMGIEDPRDYLNSGVLLLDLARLREERLSSRLREYAIAHPDNQCPEQDALSVLMRGRWVSLHPRWNAQSALYDDDLPISKSPFSAQQTEEALARPAIVHFNGPFKPWHYWCQHRLRHLYFEHLRCTPWPEEPLKLSGLAFRLARPLSMTNKYRFLMYIYLPAQKTWRAARSGIKKVLGKSA